jgi:hypothetical protein
MLTFSVKKALEDYSNKLQLAAKVLRTAKVLHAALSPRI